MRSRVRERKRKSVFVLCLHVFVCLNLLDYIFIHQEKTLSRKTIQPPIKVLGRPLARLCDFILNQVIFSPGLYTSTRWSQVSAPAGTPSTACSCRRWAAACGRPVGPASGTWCWGQWLTRSSGQLVDTSAASPQNLPQPESLQVSTDHVRTDGV